MTVQSTNVQTTANGNGVATVFTYQFKLQQAADLVVQLIDNLGVVYAALVLNTDYTVDPLGIGLDSGGNITYSPFAGPLPTGWQIVMTREMGFVQGTDLVNQGNSMPENVETGLDTRTMENQQLNFALARAVRGALTDSVQLSTLPTALARAGKFLQFTGTGDVGVAPGSVPQIQNQYAGTIPPTVNNDSSQGYSEGSIWFDVTHKVAYICVVATVGAAVWQRLFFLNNMTAVTDPIVTSDSNAGYSVGSLWLNTVTSTLFICVNATAGAASWSILSSTSISSRNYFVDPSCRVNSAFTGALGNGPTITNAYKYGQCDLVQWKCSGTISSGNIDQIGASGNAINGTATGFSSCVRNLSGAGAHTLSVRRWVEAADAEALYWESQKRGNVMTIAALVEQTNSVGLNYTIAVNAFASVNNPAAPVNMATSANIPIANDGLFHQISLTLSTVVGGGADMRFGFEVIISWSPPSISGSLFCVTDFSAVAGSFAPALIQVASFAEDLARSRRYYEQSYEYGTAPGSNTFNGGYGWVLGGAVANSNNIGTWRYQVQKLIAPTVVSYSDTGASGNIRDATVGNKAVTVTADTSSFLLANNSGGALVAGNPFRMQYTADARL